MNISGSLFPNFCLFAFVFFFGGGVGLEWEVALRESGDPTSSSWPDKLEAPLY